mmetsp:Transcript_78699/g.220594  ORF Transcript_78699/g.220594 Transcript_78699/m.220594 type:complete len:169 (-) Transcript_78699:62-568(-)
MKPDWDKLTAEYAGHATTLIADVDCTSSGKSLCEQVGVRGYPTIKHGDPNDMQDYKGGRDYSTLKKFAEGLGPQCGPAKIDLCDDEKKKQIQEFQALSTEARDQMIKDKEEEIAKLEADFKAMLDGLQKEYTAATEKKDKEIEAVKEAGLGLLKSVHAYEKKAGKSEL